MNRKEYQEKRKVIWFKIDDIKFKSMGAITDDGARVVGEEDIAAYCIAYEKAVNKKVTKK